MGANIYKNKKPLFLFLVPAFAFMAIFLYYPFIQNILNSFKQITELGAASPRPAAHSAASGSWRS